MRIVGTAGHVDHGKSSLVISLTGHDPDRWIEERERGMTLDLGFAPLHFSDGTQAGVIDVPGHERFLHNMLAGAPGIDVLLLVIDALEGPRAQTREHLQILSFLNVQRAIIVLTKSDLVDEAEIELASARAREFCAGTVAAGAPVVPVSNVTGAGIDELKAAIYDAIVSLPPRRVDAPAFLPVDRVFALQGHGTIVTGTLMQGSIRTGEVLEMQPAGRPARVRSLQIFGRKVDSADAGSRVAVNLPGIDAAAIRRGDVLAANHEFKATSELMVEFTPLPDALPLIHRRTPVRVHIGSAEIEGRLVFKERPIDARPLPARLLLSRPTVSYRGSRLIVRRSSPKDLLGGGIFLERSASVATDRDPEMPDDEACFEVISSARFEPIATSDVASGANVREEVAAAAIARLVQNGRIVAIARPVGYISRAADDEAFASAQRLMRERHDREPWLLGCSTAAIAATMGASDALAVRLLAAWHEDGRIGHRARHWHLPDFTPSLTKDQLAFFETALAARTPASLLPASYDAVAKAVDSTSLAGGREALESLIATGVLIRIGDDLYRRAQLTRAQTLVAGVLQNNAAGATMSQLKDAFGTSRKYALPLLEHLDTIGFTIRDGDVRRLRGGAGKPGAQVQN